MSQFQRYLVYLIKKYNVSGNKKCKGNKKKKKKDQKYREKIEDIFTKQGVDVVTILEDILLKGEKKGRIEGKIEDKQEIIINQITKKFGIT